MDRLRRRLSSLQARLDAVSLPAVPTVPPMSPVELFEQVTGARPDGWQELVLTSTDPRICLLCARQTGKSTVVAVKALHIALYQSQSLILLPGAAPVDGIGPQGVRRLPACGT
jgi:hypothetical protein